MNTIEFQNEWIFLVSFDSKNLIILGRTEEMFLMLPMEELEALEANLSFFKADRTCL